MPPEDDVWIPLVDELQAVADEIAADPRYADDEAVGPDDAVRERFRAFARERLQ